MFGSYRTTYRYYTSIHLSFAILSSAVAAAASFHVALFPAFKMIFFLCSAFSLLFLPIDPLSRSNSSYSPSSFSLLIMLFCSLFSLRGSLQHFLAQLDIFSPAFSQIFSFFPYVEMNRTEDGGLICNLRAEPPRPRLAAFSAFACWQPPPNRGYTHTHYMSRWQAKQEGGTFAFFFHLSFSIHIRLLLTYLAFSYSSSSSYSPWSFLLQGRSTH